MDATTFNKFREIIYQKSGINLGPGKEALVSARIGKRMRALQIEDQRAYLKFVEEDAGDELVHLIDAISTNVTSFFREPIHFDFARNVLEKWSGQGQRRFRIWCAAASSGEEPYSIAITLYESLNGAVTDARILATDISTRVLQKCIEGVYSGEKVEPVPPLLREKYFSRVSDHEGNKLYSVKPMLRQMLTFKRLNLSTPPFPMQGPMDIVFCRNVMIYFDNHVRSRLLDDIYRLLKPGGYLFVGHAESLTGMMSQFKTVQPSVYIK